METKQLLLLAFIVASVVLFAEVDITPSRYIFANQPIGQYKADAANAGANPPAGWADPVSKFDNGYFVLAGGPAVFTSLDAVQPAAVQEGINIVDLGGEVGKVFVMRGKTSTLNVGTPMGSGYAGAWFNLNFYFDKNTAPVRENVRVRLVFSIYENVISPTGSSLGKFYTQNSQNNTSPALADVPQVFPGDDFQVTDEYGDPVPNDEGEAYYDPSKWMIYEFDAYVPEEDGNPNRLKIEILATAGNMTLFIKEIKFIKDPSGDPVVREIITLEPGVSGLKLMRNTYEKLQFTVQHNTVNLENVTVNDPISVLNANGQLIRSMTAQGNQVTLQLNQGFYIIKAANKTAKVAIP
ncbi:MAG: hypothetical protein M0Q54_06245 [Pigmentiphaga sp.]|nr:hypothetical protein [Pigmentiphaga sp.]